MRTLISFGFMSTLGFLTQFAWISPFTHWHPWAPLAVFAIFALGASAFAVAPALSESGWASATLFSALFGLAMAGGLYTAGRLANADPIHQLAWSDVASGALLAGAYGWSAYALTSFLIGKRATKSELAIIRDRIEPDDEAAPARRSALAPHVR